MPQWQDASDRLLYRCTQEFQWRGVFNRGSKNFKKGTETVVLSGYRSLLEHGRPYVAHEVQRFVEFFWEGTKIRDQPINSLNYAKLCQLITRITFIIMATRCHILR